MTEKNSHMSNKSYQLSRKNPLINLLNETERASPLCYKDHKRCYRQKAGERLSYEMIQLSVKSLHTAREYHLSGVSHIYPTVRTDIKTGISHVHSTIRTVSKYSIISDFPCGSVVRFHCFTLQLNPA